MLAVCTIAIGLVVYRHGLGMTPAIRDFAGDALWAMMMAWWIGALSPRTAMAKRLSLALAVAWLVELSQLIRAPMLDDIRRTTLGHLMLGSDFAARDLAAYGVGVIVAGMLEYIVFDRPNR